MLDADRTNDARLRQDNSVPHPAVAPQPRDRINPDDVRRMADEGHISAEIAVEIGCHVTSVRRVARAHGITLPLASRAGKAARVFWDQRDDELRSSVANGDTSAVAAAKLGVSKGAVIGRARRLNLNWARSPNYVPRVRVATPEPGQCRYIGDPSDGYCCFDRTKPGSSYCPRHHGIVFRPVESNILVRRVGPAARRY